MKLTIKPIEKKYKNCFVITFEYKHGTGNDDLYTYRTYTIHNSDYAMLETYLKEFIIVSEELDNAIVEEKMYNSGANFFDERINPKREYQDGVVYSLSNMTFIDINYDIVQFSMHRPVIGTPYVILYEQDVLSEGFATMSVKRIEYYDDNGDVFEVVDEDNSF
jgi:hypothetical protein